MRAVRKGLAIAGLLILGLLGYQLMLGQITLVDAAQRATAVMFALMLLQWLTRMVISSYVRGLERSAKATAQPGGAMSDLRQAVDLHRE
jgi:hypothetical protein